MLRNDMERYIQLRRNAGFKMANEALMLASFIKTAEMHDQHFVRMERVLETPAGKAPSESQRHRRICTVRHFAQSLQAEDGRHEVPPRDAFGRRKLILTVKWSPFSRQ